jgi:transposase
MHSRNTDVPDKFWTLVEPLFPKRRRSRKGGRPPVPDRVVLAGVLYKLRTGCQWKAIPDTFGSGSTCHRRFAEWVGRGIFDRMYTRLLKHYDDRVGLNWMWTALDGAIVKAPKGGTTLAETPQIGRKAARNGTSLRTPRASRSVSSSAAQTCPICGWH